MKEDFRVKKIKEIFKNDDTFYMETIVDDEGNTLCDYCYLNGLSSPEKIGELLIHPLKQFQTNVQNIDHNKGVKDYLFSANFNETDSLQDAIHSFLNGDTIILVPNQTSYLLLDTKNNIFRTTSEPGNEKVIYGPHEGFVENSLTNSALIRRHIKNPSFKVQFLSMTGETKSTLCLMYVDELVHPELLREVKDRLTKCLEDKIPGANPLIEKIRDDKKSIFKTIGKTERPDVAAVKLLEGKIAVIVDGSPVCILLPYFFYENFENASDYYENFYFATINRNLRILSFFLEITIPALYVAFVNYHQELIPIKLALSISASRDGVPIPAFLECFFLLLMFEILRESGSKVPNLLGSSLSVVGALIIGQATVEARLVSTSVVIIVAVSAVMSLVVTRLQVCSLICKMFLLVCSAILGIHGFIVGLAIILLHLISLTSFGYAYVDGTFSINPKHLKKAYIRSSYANKKGDLK